MSKANFAYDLQGKDIKVDMKKDKKNKLPESSLGVSQEEIQKAMTQSEKMLISSLFGQSQEEISEKQNETLTQPKDKNLTKMEKNSNKIVSKSDLDVLPTQDLQTTVWSDEEDETQVVTKINNTVEHFLKVPKESNLPLGKKQLKKMKKVKFETTSKPEIRKISQQVVAEVHRSQDSEGQEDHDAIMQEQRYAIS